MSIEWVGKKEETLACLTIFTLVGTILGLLMAAGPGSPLLTVATGTGVGLTFWALFAVQDLRVLRNRRSTEL